MNNKEITNQLEAAVAALATTISEIIDFKIREPIQDTDRVGAGFHAINSLSPADGWAGKRATAEHFNVSLRIVDNYMKKGLTPYMRMGRRGVRFELNDVDETFQFIKPAQRKCPNLRHAVCCYGSSGICA